MSGNLLLNLKAEIFQNLNLTTLDLSMSDLSSLTKICPRQSPFLHTLQNLVLKSTNISGIPRYIFSCFPNLQILILEDNNLTSFLSFCNIFHKNRTAPNDLITLSLGNTSLSGNISTYVFRCFPKLTSLKLDRNGLTDIPNFCNTKYNVRVPRIKQLNLQFTSISDIWKHSLKCLTSLVDLDLSNNILRDPPSFCSQNYSSYTPKLSKLFLRNTSILTLRRHKFRCLLNLKALDLSSNYFKDIPSFCNESNASTNPSLEKLDLSNNKIQTIFTGSFRCLTSLKTLYLSHTVSKNLKIIYSVHLFHLFSWKL